MSRWPPYDLSLVNIANKVYAKRIRRKYQAAEVAAEIGTTEDEIQQMDWARKPPSKEYLEWCGIE